MCRNIKNLFNFDPPVNDQEVHNASLQFVRKISGFNKPSKANEAAFNPAIDEITTVCRSSSPFPGNHRPPKTAKKKPPRQRPAPPNASATPDLATAVCLSFRTLSGAEGRRICFWFPHLRTTPRDSSGPHA